MTVIHDDLRAGRLSIYKLTACEALDIVAEYDAVLAERDRLRAMLQRWLTSDQARGDGMQSGTTLLHSDTREALGREPLELNHSETPDSSPAPPSLEEIATSSGVESAPAEFSQLKFNSYCITHETLREWEQRLVDALNENGKLRAENEKLQELLLGRK